MTAITCEAAVLGAALKSVTSIVNKQETLPILSHVLIETLDGAIRITGTDMSKRVERTIAADVQEAGSFTVEAARFTAYVSAAPAGAQADIRTANNGIAVKYGRSRGRFATLSAEHFPPAVEREALATFTGGADFVRALTMTRHAHGNLETQVFTLGALLTDRDGLEVVAVGNGGERLAIIHVGGEGVPNAIIPTGTVDLILRLADGEFQVQVQDGHIRCDFGMTVVTGKLIEAVYPDYMRPVPKGKTAHAVTVSGDDMIGALGRMALMADDKDRKVRVQLEAGKMTLTLDTNVDQAVEELVCDYEGDPLLIGFKSAYLRDAFQALDADDVEIAMDSPRSPVRITAKQRPNATLIVAPMAV